MTSSITNATGTKATKPSANRTIGRDQRAGDDALHRRERRPAVLMTVKNSQLKCNACHARS